MQIVREFTPNASLKPLGRVRTRAIRNLSDGQAVGVVADQRRSFEEEPVFGLMANRSVAHNPAKWLASQIQDLGSSLELEQRPVILPAPLTALAHSQTSKVCSDAVHMTNLCHQEICIEFDDAAFAGDSYDAVSRLTRLKREGFRVGANISRSFNSRFTESEFLLLDTLRVSVANLYHDAALLAVVESAAQMGTMVIATDAKWRDADTLSNHGIYCAIDPKTDS